MNNFNYLLLIIFIILLIFYIYINYNINLESFLQLPPADLGPIKFVDYDSDEELGKYPSNWKDSELYSEDRYLEPTIIYIKRGPPGSKGQRGQSGTPGICEGNINISTIVGDDLEIASNNLKIASDNATFKNKLCFGDDKKACLDKDLIQKIKTNKTIENERNDCRSQLSILRQCCTAKSDLVNQVSNLENERNDFEQRFNECNTLITNHNEYVTRIDCTKEVTDKNQEWVSQNLEETIQKQSEQIRNLEVEKFNLTSLINNRNMYRTFDEWEEQHDAKNQCIAENDDKQSIIDDYRDNWVEDGNATFSNLHPDIKEQYGKITTPDSNGFPDEYIKHKDCSVAIANDGEYYVNKSQATYNDLSDDEKALYGKITTPDSNGLPENYIKHKDCRVAIANDRANYGEKGTTPGKFGLIGNDTSERMDHYIQKNKCHYGIAKDRREYGKIKTPTNDGEYGKIGLENHEYISRSEYNLLNESLTTERNKTDMSGLSSINFSDQSNDLDIYGDALNFSGNRITFDNKVCVKPRNESPAVCLTAETIRAMKAAPCGISGSDGKCSG